MKNKTLYIIFILLIIIFSASVVSKVLQNDTFFTIPIARDIIERGGLDGIDHLTQHENLTFTHSGWIFDLSVLIAYEMMDFFGVYLLTILITILISLLLFSILIKEGNNIIFSFLVTIFMILSSQDVFAARGQLFSFWIFLLEMHAINGLVKTNKNRYVFLLLVLPIILANTHDTVWPFYFILFLPYIAEFIVSKIKILRKEEPYKILIDDNIPIKKMLFIIVISLLTGLITPVFGTTYINLFSVMSGVSSTFIQELQPTNILEKIPLLFIIFLCVGIIGFTKTKIRLKDLLYVFGFTLLSLMAARNIFFLYLLGIVSVANIITAFLKTYEKDGKLEEATNRLEKNNKFLLVGSLIIILISVSWLLEKMNDEYVDDLMYPIEAVEWMKKNVDIENMTIYNGFNYGSYLELHGIKVFMDSRSGIYCEEFTDGSTIMTDYLAVDDGQINYEEVFEKYGITHVLIENDSLINQYIYKDENYECIYQDDVFVLYKKNVDI